jgi:DNA (cytosine-5)-methyltransferase 1
MMFKNLTHLSLFSGIGGIDIAAELAGFKSVGQCDFTDFPAKVLEKHLATVPRWRDIRDVTAKSFSEVAKLRRDTQNANKNKMGEKQRRCAR